MTPPSPAAGAAWLGPAGTRFRVWAPQAERVELVLEDAGGGPPVGLTPAGDGWFELMHRTAGPGTLYRYLVDGNGPFPDPASRFQPRGVHGPSEVIDPGAFAWSDAGWTGVPLERLVLYELHVGSFTAEGTFRAAIARLPELVDLGITALELMPLADFPGARNWGYDGVAPYAPARCYGRPDDLRALVDAAHRVGLAVHLDVVYNHLGPDGAYQGCFSPLYYSATHRTPWGAALNFDGPGSAPVRDYVIDNAVAWVREYHVDGLRLDATHAIVDESPRHILAALADAVHRAARTAGRSALVIAEDVRNLAHMVRPEAEGGWGLDAVWSDDFHHQLRRRLVGDADGYFQDFSGSTADLAATARRGWFYRGQYAGYFGRPRGTDPAGLPARRFVFFLQNHDQVGNRALGDRLHHGVSPAVYRAASTLLLVLPETPLLFMGQEWAAASPFLYFTDHHPELGEAVRRGRREEFARFAAFRDPAARERIPDPQAAETFAASRLSWDEREREPHRGILALYRQLLALRRGEPALGGGGGELSFDVVAFSVDVLLVRRRAGAPDAGTILAIIRLGGAGPVELREHAFARLDPGQRWEPVLSTGDERFAAGGRHIAVHPDGPAADFPEPGAVLLRVGDGSA
jgi:maltooligosyltrehalose trehalohydrolase